MNASSAARRMRRSGSDHPREPARELDPDLALRVERTRGLQPWRRAFHAGSGVLLALGPPWLGLHGSALVGLLAGVLGVLLAVDVARLRVRRLNALFFRAFSALASPREAAGMASSTWYVGGVLVLYALFPTAVAVPAILVLGLADPAAAVVGRRWGRRRFGSGTAAGSLAFLAVATGVLLAFVPPAPALAVAVVATLVEAIPWKVDDNLAIPLATAAALALLGP